MTAVNLALVAFVLGCGLMASMRAPWLVAALVVGLALAGLLALARRQGTQCDEIPLPPWQWAMVIVIWSGIVLWSVTCAWSSAIVWSEPVSLSSLTESGTPARDDSMLRALRSLSAVAARVTGLT